MRRLIEAHTFETFLGTKFANDKRFGLEGCETLIPGMLALIDRSAALGVEAMVVGMPHRGRLNVRPRTQPDHVPQRHSCGTPACGHTASYNSLLHITHCFI
eukprot:SAG11_NODE_208_length_12354_cov_19.490167_4_plen_101_part_00